MTTRSQFRVGVQTFLEDATGETVFAMAPLFFQEDFIGAGNSTSIPASGAPVAGYPWVKKIVGAAPPTVGLIANAPGGQVSLALTATSEKQDATLYWNDNLALDGTKKSLFEARAALAIPPSAAGVQMVMGLAAAWIDGPDNNSFYVEFGCTASGALLIRSKDGITTNSIAATLAGAAVVLDTAMHVFRIDISDTADVGFHYDGNRVNASGSIRFLATGANAILQPYFSVYKPSGVGVATLNVDKIDAWSSR